MRYVRATTSSKGGEIERLYNIIPGKVEASEIIIKKNSPIANVPLHKLSLKPNVLVTSITRGDTVIIPRGGDVIREGDAVVIITGNLSIHEIGDVLK